MAININQPWPYLATAVFIALIGIYAWRQPRRPGTRYFIWMAAVWLAWALAAGLATVVQSGELRYGLWALQSVSAILLIHLRLMFALEYTGNERWLSRRNLFLLALPAFILALALFGLPTSLLASIDNHSGFEVISIKEPIKWGLFAYGSVVMLIVLGVLFTSMQRAPAFRAPIVWIMLAEIVPTVGYVLLEPQRLTVPPIQVVVLFTNFAALAYSLALYNYHILQVIPVARDKAINLIALGLIVLDAEGRLVDFNTAAQALPGLPGRLVLREPAARALGEWWIRLSPLIGPEALQREVTFPSSAGQQYFEVTSLPLLQASGWRVGQVYILQEVTRARQEQQQRAHKLWAQASLQEREQLASELHDGLSQGLAFLSLQAQAAQVYLQAGESTAAQASLDRLSEAAGEIQEETRGLIGDLLSVSLLADNFSTTLCDVLARFEQQSGLPVRLEMDGGAASFADTYLDPRRLTPPVAVQLIRITQEALANVRKHAQDASQVWLELKTRDGKLLLIIKDDGSGFDPDARPSGEKHFGLQVMQQRAARIGGQVVVNSAPGKGTRVEVCAPLASEETRSLR